MEIGMKSFNDLTALEQTQDLISDLYKDVYGFRPRGIYTPQQWGSLEFLDAEIKRLSEQLKVVEQEQVSVQEIAILVFETRVRLTIEAGAKDRLTAIKWIFDAEDEHVRNEPDFFCYKNGLPYGYFNGVF